jgi:hypothetical protein
MPRLTLLLWPNRPYLKCSLVTTCLLTPLDQLVLPDAVVPAMELQTSTACHNFTGGPQPLQECVPGAQKLLTACRGAGITIVHTLEAHKVCLSAVDLGRFLSILRILRCIALQLPVMKAFGVTYALRLCATHRRAEFQGAGCVCTLPQPFSSKLLGWLAVLAQFRTRHRPCSISWQTISLCHVGRGYPSLRKSAVAPQPDLSDLHQAKARRGNPPPGSRIGDDAGAMGRILIRDSPGNGIIDELVPAEVLAVCVPCG